MEEGMESSVLELEDKSKLKRVVLSVGEIDIVLLDQKSEGKVLQKKLSDKVLFKDPKDLYVEKEEGLSLFLTNEEIARVLSGNES